MVNIIKIKYLENWTNFILSYSQNLVSVFVSWLSKFIYSVLSKKITLWS